MLLIKNVFFYCISSQSRRSMEREKKRLPDLASYKRQMDGVIINIVCSLGNHKYFMLKCGGGNAKVIIFRIDTRFIKKKKIKNATWVKTHRLWIKIFLIWLQYMTFKYCGFIILVGNNFREFNKNHRFNDI